MDDFVGSSMKRRAFIGTMVSGLLAAPLAAYTGEVAIVITGAALPGGPGNVPLADHPEKVGARWVTADSIVIASSTAGQPAQAFLVEGVPVRYVRQ
jgi:hypothetical protein